MNTKQRGRNGLLLFARGLLIGVVLPHIHKEFRVFRILVVKRARDVQKQHVGRRL